MASRSSCCRGSSRTGLRRRQPWRGSPVLRSHEHPLVIDADVPNALGLALRGVADRLFNVLPDGSEDADASGIVVGVLGPAVHNGGLLLSLGIESFGFNPPMVEMRIRIFVEELEPLAVPVELTAASWVTDEIRATWRSSAERLEG